MGATEIMHSHTVLTRKLQLVAIASLQGVCCGNVPVKNNANCFLFQKANLPIFIHKLC